MSKLWTIPSQVLRGSSLPSMWTRCASSPLLACENFTRFWNVTSRVLSGPLVELLAAPRWAKVKCYRGSSGNHLSVLMAAPRWPLGGPHPGCHRLSGSGLRLARPCCRRDWGTWWASTFCPNCVFRGTQHLPQRWEANIFCWSPHPITPNLLGRYCSSCNCDNQSTFWKIKYYKNVCFNTFAGLWWWTSLSAVRSQGSRWIIILWLTSSLRLGIILLLETNQTSNLNLFSKTAENLFSRYQ